jgi:hypothetical protein
LPVPAPYLRRTTKCCSCGGWKIPAGGRFTIVDFRLSIADLRSAFHCGGSRMSFSRVRNGALTLRDVKNEDRSGYVYENTVNDDKMSGEKTSFCTKMYPFHDNRQQSVGLMGRKCTSQAINRGEVAPLEPALSGCQGSRGGTGVRSC